MKIGELSELAGISTKTIRYYEQIGILPAPQRQQNGYRDYSSDTLDTLRFIHSAQAIGLTLGEIREIIALRNNGDAPCTYVLDLIKRHRDDISERILELTLLQEELKTLYEEGSRLDPAECPPSAICHVIKS